MLWTTPATCSSHHGHFGWSSAIRPARVPASCRHHIACRAHPTPEEALAAAAAELGLSPERLLVASSDADADEWEDIMEEMEDPWMREPAAPLAIDGLTAPKAAPSTSRGFTNMTNIDQLKELHALHGDMLVVIAMDGDAHPHHAQALQSMGMLRPWAASLQGAAAVVVLDSNDHRSQQAVVRLVHVFDLPATVYHLTTD